MVTPTDAALVTPEVFSPEWRARFWSYAKPDGECLKWTGGHTPAGYGIVCTKAITELRKREYAHRVSWMLDHGAIPKGMQVLHHCDNPPCIWEPHLFLGDQMTNIHDMIAKGRMVRPKPKLSPEIVLEIRKRYAAGGVTFVQLAADYDIAFQHAHAIVRGTRWGSLHV